MAKRFKLLTVFTALFALALFAIGPVALAHHADDHAQGGGSENSQSDEHSNEARAEQQSSDHDGDADSDSSSTQTENDPDPRESAPEDQADEGDNAHPSGKDRSVENGNSESNPNQGKSESNPDDSKGPMRQEGGPGDDKPNGPGGVDAADQDGNNGCGNDDDFDDDNNGWCGKPTTPQTPPQVQGKSEEKKPCDANPNMPGVQKCETPPAVSPDVVTQPDTTPDAVLPELEVRPAKPAEQGEVEDSVLGIRLSRDAAQPAAVAPAVVRRAAKGAVLPFTGSETMPFLGAGLALILIGAGLTRVARSKA